MFSIFDKLHFTVKANKETLNYLAFFSDYKATNPDSRLTLFRKFYNLSIEIPEHKSIKNIDFGMEYVITDARIWSLSETMTNAAKLAKLYADSLDKLLKETILKITYDHKILEKQISHSKEVKNDRVVRNSLIISCSKIARFASIMTNQVIILTQRLICNPCIAEEYNELYQRSLYSKIYSCLNKIDNFSYKVLCSLEIAKDNILSIPIEKQENNQNKLRQFS